MELGIIAKSETSDNLVINSIGKYRETQKGVAIRKDDAEYFKLEEGDKIEYDGVPYDTVYIFQNLTKQIKTNEKRYFPSGVNNTKVNL